VIVVEQPAQNNSENQQKSSKISNFVKILYPKFKKSVKHFSNFNFCLLATSTFVIYALYNIPIYFIVELLKNYGFTESHSAGYLSLIGISLMSGMLVLGYIGDLSVRHIKYVNAFCVLICGLSEALLPLAARNFTTFAIFSGIFGFTFASAYVLIPKIAEMIVGTEDFASALGLNFFVQGLGLLLGTPFGSMIYEVSGRWVLKFYIKLNIN
jgi:predicted MFS family arabinose efflux permease